MNRLKKVLALILALVCVCSFVGCKPNRRLSKDEKDRIAQRFESTMYSCGFSGAVYAVYRDEVIYDSGAGMATDTLKNGSDIAYGVASLTKQFTAAAVMQLYEQDKLDLNDPLSRYFPDYRFGGEICIKHLLSQRSGIPDYQVESVDDLIVVSCPGSEKYITVSVDQTAEENREKIREFFLSMELLFEPGEEFDYSDSNYALLAEIIAQVSGMSYHEYVRKNIFEPLGMESSAFIDDYDKNVIKKVAQTDRLEFNRDYYTVGGAEYGCGDILSTPQDLYRWYRGFVDNRVVGEGAYQLMTTNFSGPFELGYGYGLMISDNSESRVVYHYGFIPSYYSSVIYIPEYDYCQVVLSNHGSGNPHLLAADLAEYFGSVIDLTLIDID